MGRGDDDHGIETLASDGTNQTFDIRILPGAGRRGDDLGDAHARESALKDGAVDAVPIAVQPVLRQYAIGVVPGKPSRDISTAARNFNCRNENGLFVRHSRRRFD